MQYTEDFIKKVLEKVDIVKLIQKYTKLDKQEELFVGKCPLHKGQSETMVVYPKEKVFTCFECGKSGNAAIFLMELKGISMSKAIEELALKVGIVATKNDVLQKNNNVLKSNLYALYNDATIFYQKKLKDQEGVDAVKYLKKRELSEQTIEQFKLGYSPTKGNALYKYLKAKGYTKELMLESGLIKMAESGPYDMFRGRVIFPIMDKEKRVIAFGGRVMDDSKPKYLNSPESPIFNKSTTLYGVHNSKGNIKGYYLLCEGYMDVISLHQAGFTNAIATLGTAFTKTHIPEVKKYTNNLVLTFDADGAGQKAAMRTIKAIDGSGMGVRVLSMSPCKDPDEFIKTFGADEYKVRIKRSLQRVDFQLKCLANQYDLDDPDQKKIFLDKAVDAMMKQQNRNIAKVQVIGERC